MRKGLGRSGDTGNGLVSVAPKLVQMEPRASVALADESLKTPARGPTEAAAPYVESTTL